jgi:hypothetical protein
MRHQLRSLLTSAAQPASLNKLRLLVTTLETALTAFRDSQRRTYEVLRRDEMEITGQLSEFEQLAQDWSSESLADLDKRLGAPVVVPPSLPPRRPRSASSGAVRRLLQQPGVAAVPPVPPTGSQDAADDAEAARRAALLRSKEKLERERKQAALEVYRKQKQLEELHEQEVC